MTDAPAGAARVVPLPPAAVGLLVAGKAADAATTLLALRLPGTTEAVGPSAFLIGLLGRVPGVLVAAVLAVALTVAAAEGFRVVLRRVVDAGYGPPRLPAVGQWGIYLAKAVHFAVLAASNARLLLG